MERPRLTRLGSAGYDMRFLYFCAACAAFKQALPYRRVHRVVNEYPHRVVTNRFASFFFAISHQIRRKWLYAVTHLFFLSWHYWTRAGTMFRRHLAAFRFRHFLSRMLGTYLLRRSGASSAQRSVFCDDMHCVPVFLARTPRAATWKWKHCGTSRVAFRPRIAFSRGCWHFQPRVRGW